MQVFKDEHFLVPGRGHVAPREGGKRGVVCLSGAGRERRWLRGCKVVSGVGRGVERVCVCV